MYGRGPLYSPTLTPKGISAPLCFPFLTAKASAYFQSACSVRTEPGDRCNVLAQARNVRWQEHARRPRLAPHLLFLLPLAQSLGRSFTPLWLRARLPPLPSWDSAGYQALTGRAGVRWWPLAGGPLVSEGREPPGVGPGEQPGLAAQTGVWPRAPAADSSPGASLSRRPASAVLATPLC